mgnify:CR=1 FL=1
MYQPAKSAQCSDCNPGTGRKEFYMPTKKFVRFSDLKIEFKPAKTTIKTAAILAIAMLCLGAVLYGTDIGATKLLDMVIQAIAK